MQTMRGRSGVFELCRQCLKQAQVSGMTACKLQLLSSNDCNAQGLRLVYKLRILAG